MIWIGNETSLSMTSHSHLFDMIIHVGRKEVHGCWVIRHNFSYLRSQNIYGLYFFGKKFLFMLKPKVCRVDFFLPFALVSGFCMASKAGISYIRAMHNAQF